MTKKLTVLMLCIGLGMLKVASADTSACKDSVALAFSPAFSLCKPLAFYKNVKIAKADGWLVKFANGSYFSGQVIIPSVEGLPDGFDMRTYPLYALGLRDAHDLPDAQAAKFINSIKAARMAGKPEVHQQDKFVVYVAMGEAGMDVYVTRDDRLDQVLLLQFPTASASLVSSIVKGIK